jgi:hypothetical protein
MSASPEHCLRCLTRLRGMVRLPKDMRAEDMDLQLSDYARELTRYEPQDVESAVMGWARRSKWWPTLAELVEVIDGQRAAREAKARLRSLPPPVDGWSAPFGQLGIGLQVARGQFLMAERDAVDARVRFNAVVGMLGLGPAREIADRLYHPGGDHRAIMTALEQAASQEAAA